MQGLSVGITTPSRKAIRADQVKDTNSVHLTGFDHEARYFREDLLALAKLFTGLAAMLGD